MNNINYSRAEYDEYCEEDELDLVDINLIGRQLEIVDVVLNEYDAFYRKFHKVCNDAFMYAPDTLDWAAGASMASVIGHIEEETSYLKSWKKHMREYYDRRYRKENGLI